MELYVLMKAYGELNTSTSRLVAVSDLKWSVSQSIPHAIKIARIHAMEMVATIKWLTQVIA